MGQVNKFDQGMWKSMKDLKENVRYMTKEDPTGYKDVIAKQRSTLKYFMTEFSRVA